MDPATTESWTAAGDVDQWRSVLSATHLPWTVAIPAQRGFRASARRWWIDDLAMVDCECGPCSGTRARRQLADTDGEYVVVLITRSGAETVTQGTAEAAMRPGDAVVWDSTRPARFLVTEPLAKRSLLIPRAALDEVGGRRWSPGAVLLDAGAPATRLLTGYLDTLGAILPELHPAQVTAARNATLELFIGAARAADDVVSTGTARPALRATIDRFIERHLAGDAVTPAAIAAAHGVSTRTVHRLFNATGETIGEVVRMRRLARAREEVTDTDRSIAAIAHRWGFADTSHFSRAFKAHYGAAPTDYRHAVRGAPVRSPGAPARGAPVRSPGAPARGAPVQRSGAPVQASGHGPRPH